MMKIYQFVFLTEEFIKIGKMYLPVIPEWHVYNIRHAVSCFILCITNIGGKTHIRIQVIAIIWNNFRLLKSNLPRVYV